MFQNSKRFVSVFLLLCSLLTGGAVSYAAGNDKLPQNPATAGTQQNPSDKELDLILGKMKTIETNKDQVETTKAIASLRDFPYRRVLNFVMNKLNSELSKPKPNTYHVAEYLNAIDSMGSIAEVDAFNKIYQKFKASKGIDPRAATKIDTRFLEVREDIRNNPTPLPAEQPSENSEDDLFQKQLQRDAAEAKDEDLKTAAKIILMVTTEFMTDRVKKSIDDGSFVEIIGRDKETERAIDTLVRIKGKNPIFIGVPGVGKTAAADRMAQIIVEHLYPDTEVFHDAFSNAEMIQVTPAKISRLAKSNDPNSMAAAVEDFFDAVLYYEQNYAKEHDGEKKPILVFVDEFHSLGESQVEALLPYMDARERGISVFGASNSDKFQLKFKNNEALIRRVEQIGLEEFDEATTIEVLKASWIPVIEKKYSVTFTPEAIEAAVKVAPFLQPDTARPDGPFKVLQGLAIRVHRASTGQQTEINDAEIYNYAKDITGLPVNPHDGKAFQAYLQEKENEINAVVVEQKSIVHRLVERVGNLLIGTPRRPQVVGIIGTTGTGKTLIAETLADKVFGSKSRVLIIDGNDYATGGLSLDTLIGAPNGVITSDKHSGVLCEFLDDPSRGKLGGVIVINEAEKMHPDAWKRLMEFFDKGVLTGGDGKTRHANRHIVILTSNRGAKIVFPDNVTMWSQSEINRRISDLKPKDIAALFKQKTDGNDEFQLPPEVLARIDDWMIANPGSREGAIEVAQREANKITAEMTDQYHINLDISPAVIEHLALTGFTVTDGYRFVAKQVESYLKSVMRDARAHWDIPRDGTLKIGLLKNEDSAEVHLQITNDQGETVMLDAPEQKFYNPLQDKEVLEKIKAMPDKMKKQIIGQDAALRSAADMILAKYADVGRKTAVSFAIVGPTGVGKTELGRAIAEALFGSPDRVQIIPLGNVNFEGRLNDIFNSPAGYVDSHKIGKFERALMNTPNGGVIVFDEFSNMGGGEPGRKEELFKQYFYEILDEGTWTSTATGKTYDLRNHIFEFTGNDLQELFAGLITDKSRLDVYEENNTKVKIRAGLMKNGVPQALIGRFADVILAKPLLSTEMKWVTEKELNRQIRRLQEQHKGLKITYDDQFLNVFTRAFFSHDTGGRSVRAALENRLGALIGKALMQSGEVGHDLSAYTFKLHISDNLTKKPYRRTKVPDRKVILGVEVFKDGTRLGYVDNDFTEFAPEVEVPIGKHAESVAYHEAGHAVLNDPALTNMILDFITIRYAHFPQKDGSTLIAKGYASYKPIPGADTNPDYEKTMARLVMSWGGRVSQELAGLPPEAGWSNDLLQMRSISTQYLTTWGLDKDLVGIAVGKKGEPILTGRQRAIFDKKQNDMIETAHQIAIQALTAQWPLVRGIVAGLMKNGDIDQKGAKTLAQRLEEKLKAQPKFKIQNYADWQERQQATKAIRAELHPSCASILTDLIRSREIEASVTKK